jgi:hypothetical protein
MAVFSTCVANFFFSLSLNYFLHIHSLTHTHIHVNASHLFALNANAKECGQSKQEIRIVGESRNLFYANFSPTAVFCIYLFLLRKGGRPTGINQYPWIVR